MFYTCLECLKAVPGTLYWVCQEEHLCLFLCVVPRFLDVLLKSVLYQNLFSTINALEVLSSEDVAISRGSNR